MDELLLVLSNGKPGREADYVQWYSSQHLDDVKRVPGVADGGLYTITKPDDAARWSVAARYPLSQPVESVLQGLFERTGTDAMPLTDAIDGKSVLMMGATPIGPRVRAEGVDDRQDGVIFVVLTNATEGDDDDFNGWYSDQHIPDVLAVPGFIAAQRFKVAAETAGKASPWRYLSLYEVAPEDLDASMAELQARAGGEKMPLSPTLANDVYATLFSRAA
ncbi:MAG: hypothetical protein JOY99_17500 [Sphingomonadaceae bacterium]|nr:hypothetical protein [Sphingomonadaceae bacterium]